MSWTPRAPHFLLAHSACAEDSASEVVAIVAIVAIVRAGAGTSLQRSSTMFARITSKLGKRGLVASGLATVALVAVGALLAGPLLPSNGRTAHPSCTGGGFPAPGPPRPLTNHSPFGGLGSLSSNGCIFTDESLQPFESLTRPGNTTSQSVFVFISKFDACNQVQLEAASNIVPNTGVENFTGNIQFGTGLSTATVNGTASMFDFISNTTFTTTINVTWQGFSPTPTSI